MSLSWLTRHWELKLLALAFSAGLWVFVMSSEKMNVTLPLPVELDSVPSGLVVTSERPDTVDVQPGDPIARVVVRRRGNPRGDARPMR